MEERGDVLWGSVRNKNWEQRWEGVPVTLEVPGRMKLEPADPRNKGLGQGRPDVNKGGCSSQLYLNFKKCRQTLWCDLITMAIMWQMFSMGQAMGWLLWMHNLMLSSPKACYRVDIIGSIYNLGPTIYLESQSWKGSGSWGLNQIYVFSLLFRGVPFLLDKLSALPHWFQFSNCGQIKSQIQSQVWMKTSGLFTHFANWKRLLQGSAGNWDLKGAKWTRIFIFIVSVMFLSLHPFPKLGLQNWWCQ